MIGTNMLQMTIHRPAAPPARRWAPAASFARACAAAVCTAALLASTPWALAAQGAPPAPPATTPPAATPPAAAPGAGAQLFPGESGSLKGLESPPAKPAPAGPGGQLFPGESGKLKGLEPPPAKKAAPPPAPPPPAAPEGNAETRGLDQDIQGLKKDVVDLNKDLFILEEELLFPANTQLAVFLSMDVGDFFALDSVQLKLDQKEVINYLYTPRERDALLKGGVQRLYLGNLKVGPHELVAFFSGTGPNARAYRRGSSLRFEKGVGAKYLELKINDRQRKLEPEFEIKDWE